MKNPAAFVGMELYEYWEDALQGRLCPYEWLCLQAEYEPADLTAAQRKMLEAIRSAVSDIPQWSSEQAEQQAYRERGGKLLFCKFFAGQRSMFELAQTADKRFFTAFVLDSTLSAQKRADAAGEAKAALLQWMNEQHPALAIPDSAPFGAALYDGCFGSLEDAVRMLFAAMNAPEEICG